MAYPLIAPLIAVCVSMLLLSPAHSASNDDTAVLVATPISDAEAAADAIETVDTYPITEAVELSAASQPTNLNVNPAALRLPSADPWEGFNRKMFAFNDRLDRWVLKPVAKTYDKVTPRLVRKGIANFVYNLTEPTTALNHLLQGKPRQSVTAAYRFVFNSVTSLGLYDTANKIGLDKTPKEDFGQTLAVWGAPQGPYLMLPFMGPSTVRDTLTTPVDMQTNASPLLGTEANIGVTVVKVVDLRASLLPLEGLIFGRDRYSLIRDAFLNSRQSDVKDGAVEAAPEPEVDDSFGDDFSFAPLPLQAQPVEQVATSHINLPALNPVQHHLQQ